MESTEIRGGSPESASAASESTPGRIAQGRIETGMDAVALKSGTGFAVRSGDAGVSVGAVEHSHPAALV